MTVVLAWLLKNWKLLAVVAAVSVAILWFSNARYEAGKSDGRAEVAKAWDAENAAELKAATDAMERTAKIEREQAGR